MKRICRQCGSEFETVFNNKTCSPECLKLDQRRRNRESAAARRPKESICRDCGKGFKPSRGKRLCPECYAIKFICGICGGKKGRGAAMCPACLKAQKCPVCGKNIAGRGHQKFCSKECKKIDRQRREKEWRSKVEYFCAICGDKKGNKGKYCNQCKVKMVTCPSCGGPKSDDHIHCNKCKSKSHRYVCKKCGKECVGMNRRFYCDSCFPRCEVCGKKVSTTHNMCCSMSCATKKKRRSESTKKLLEKHLQKLLSNGYEKTGPSKPEKEWMDWFEQNNIEYETQFVIGRSHYDFKIGNILIEINPTITHNSTKPYRANCDTLPEIYHQARSLLGEQEGFQVIHIFDWDNNEKTKERLLGLIKGRKRLYGSKIVILDSKTAYDFYEKNHLQGGVGATIHYGLLSNKGELINAMSFTYRSGDWYLERFASLSGYYIAHGASKLFNHFIKEVNPSKVISYSDITKHTGGLYDALGFKLESITRPSYRWVYGMREDGIPYRRRACQKANMHNLPGFNKSYTYLENKNDEFWKQTESELMESHGYYIVYDSGNRRHVRTSPSLNLKS